MPMFPQLFESVPDALIIVDDQGCILRANRHAELLFGFGPGELAGMTVEDLVPPSARERHRSSRGGYMQHPHVRPMGGADMSLIGQRRDGRQFPVEIALSPLNDGGGAHYLASVRDISETQRARQALVRARYDAVVARIGQLALASTGTDDVIGHLPALLAEVLEVQRVAVVVNHGEEPVLSATVGDAAVGCWQALLDGPVRRAMAGERPVVMQQPEDFDTPREWPPGVASGAIVPLLDRGKPLGALVALSDSPRRFDHDALQLLQTTGNLVAAMVQRRRTEEQLAHAHRLDAIGQLTGGVAHDFNNLLTVLSGSLQLLDVECEALPGAREIISSALRSVERGAELTAKLLAFARRQHLSPRAIDPAELLGDLELMLRRTLGDAVRLTIECHPGLPRVFADPSQLDSALLNLALNARDAMPAGGQIRIGADERWVTADPTRPERKPGHYVVFRVADTGTGMAPDVLARAFEPFFTTKALGRGSGLGLSMVYGFIQQSGGYLGIESRPGEGTCIDLFLPVAPSEAAPPESLERSPLEDGTEAILVVEDQAEVRNIASAFLRSMGYQVVAAGSASEALEQLSRRDDFSLLFSDVMLGGGMSGLELAEAAQSLHPGLGVLLTSGYDKVAVAERSTFELLRKPYRREQLGLAVRRNLGAGPRASQ